MKYIAAKKETYNRFMQFKDEANTDILEEVSRSYYTIVCINHIIEIRNGWTSRKFIKEKCDSRCTTRR
jgi:hypothetical protein